MRAPRSRSVRPGRRSGGEALAIPLRYQSECAGGSTSGRRASPRAGGCGARRGARGRTSRHGAAEGRRLRTSEGFVRAHAQGRSRPADAPRRLGERAPRGARRAELRRRSEAPAAAALRARSRQATADRVGRLLPPVRPADRRARGGVGRAPRRRREPGDRRAGRRAAADDPRRRQGPRALRLVPRPPGTGAPRRRLPADPDDDLHRHGGRSLPAGVVRRADVRDGLARQLHPARRRRDAKLGEGRPAALEAVRSAGCGSRSRSAPAVSSSAPSSPIGSSAERARPSISPGSTTRPARASPIDADSLRDRPPRRPRLLEQAADRGDADRRPRAARERRLSQPADPEPPPDVALQHRQPVRAVLVPRERRRRGGDGVARVRRRVALDPAHVADAEGHAVSELEARQAVDRLRAALPPDA